MGVKISNKRERCVKSNTKKFRSAQKERQRERARKKGRTEWWKRNEIFSIVNRTSWEESEGRWEVAACEGEIKRGLNGWVGVCVCAPGTRRWWKSPKSAWRGEQCAQVRWTTREIERPCDLQQHHHHHHCLGHLGKFGQFGGIFVSPSFRPLADRFVACDWGSRSGGTRRDGGRWLTVWPSSSEESQKRTQGERKPVGHW